MTASDCARRDRVWDVIIVGQGLAGTSLAWALLDAGWSVLVIDGNEAVTSSKIAAGLITPITGKRMNESWRFNEAYGVAQHFYRRIEQRTGHRFFDSRTAIRLFSSSEECERWRDKRQSPVISHHLLNPQPDPLEPPGVTDAVDGGFAMRAAQLDVAAYLDVSRRHFTTQTMMLEWGVDVSFEEDRVLVGPFAGRFVISCEGYRATANPYFDWVPFRAAKGEILTVRFERPIAPQTLHKKIWLAPTHDPVIFRAGATYEWHEFDCVPTDAGRAEIEAGLNMLLDIPYEVIDHQAAVRPIIHNSKPVIGMHPTIDRLGYFNGLGSKGSLLAPWCAEQFRDFLVGTGAIVDDLDLRKRFLL